MVKGAAANLYGIYDRIFFPLGVPGAATQSFWFWCRKLSAFSSSYVVCTDAATERGWSSAELCSNLASGALVAR